jgi:hypothetical protein
MEYRATEPMADLKVKVLKAQIGGGNSVFQNWGKDSGEN